MCAAGAAVFVLWHGGAAEKNAPSFDVSDSNIFGESTKHTAAYPDNTSSESAVHETAVAVTSASAEERNTPSSTENITSIADITEEVTTVHENTTVIQDTTVLIKREQETEPITSEQTDIGSSPNSGDFLAWVRINGELFLQRPEYNGKSDDFSKGTYVGQANEFESYYTEDHIEYNSDLYTVEGQVDMLIMEYTAPASGRSILKKVEPTVS